MKNCLVTGGCGFIGRHFTKKMVDMGYTVTIVDNLMSKSALLPDQWGPHLICNDVHFIQRDILDYFRNVNQTFDIIIHAAAIVGGRETIENDPLLIASNITIDNELFRWIEKNPVKHLVYFSSSAVYPIRLQTQDQQQHLKLADINIEKDIIAIPDLTYGWSKLTGEYLLSILTKRIDTTITIYRPFSGYGEDQHESYPFPSIMKKVLENKPSINIWSDAVRDFVYIDDIVNYVVATCFHSDKLRTLNIGTGLPTSMSHLAKTIAKLCFQKELNINILDDKPKGVFYRVSEANNDFEWTNLNDGILMSLQKGAFQ
jgi:nucleoside-diphosphate-sugar epimerase